MPFLHTLKVAQNPLCCFQMDTPQVVTEQATKSSRGEPHQGTYELPIWPIHHLLPFVLGGGTVSHRKGDFQWELLG